jgi:hypothetical protein
MQKRRRRGWKELNSLIPPDHLPSFNNNKKKKKERIGIIIYNIIIHLTL